MKKEQENPFGNIAGLFSKPEVISKLYQNPKNCTIYVTT